MSRESIGVRWVANKFCDGFQDSNPKLNLNLAFGNSIVIYVPTVTPEISAYKAPTQLG